MMLETRVSLAENLTVGKASLCENLTERKVLINFWSFVVCFFGGRSILMLVH